MRNSRPVVLIALVALYVVTGRAAFARTTNVPADYASIQAAIDAAVTGDVVVVAKGTYKENVDFGGKAITVQSTSPADTAVVARTVIDGTRRGSVVTFRSGETATSMLRGFTITNGTGTLDQYGNIAGGGVYCGNASSPTLANNTISGNRARYGFGGGVYCELSSPVLINNTIVLNTADFGGGLSCSASSPAVTSNTIRGNWAKRGGGVWSSASSPTLTSNAISSNWAERGGGVYCDNSSPTLTSDMIRGNLADFGGGVFCSCSSPTLRSSTAASSTEGAGLYVDAAHPSNPVVAYCELSSNAGGNYVNWPDQTGGDGDTSVPSANVAAGESRETFEGGLRGGLLLTAAANSATGGVTQITVSLTSAASVQMSVLNVAGREVAVLPERKLPQGVSSLLWDGRSKAGTTAPAGSYLVLVKARGQDGGQCQVLASLVLGR